MKLIEKEWENYKASVLAPTTPTSIDRGLSEAIMNLCREAFYSGGVAVLKSATENALEEMLALKEKPPEPEGPGFPPYRKSETGYLEAKKEKPPGSEEPGG